MKFESLPLSEPLQRSLKAAKYHTPTPIQEQAIPELLKGRDLVGCAQTGTGKTAAFALPTLHRLMESSTQPARESQQPSGDKRNARRPRRPIRALILSPTRELAVQIGESLATYGRFTGLRNTVIYGGVSQRPQVRLQSGVDIVVATPGRLLDLVGQGFVDLSAVEILILDEADHMLDMGFIHDLRKIVNKVPVERQTLMFSATMPPEIRELANQWLRRPYEVEVSTVASTPERVSQSVYFVESKFKGTALAHFLKHTGYSKTLVFSRTKRGADRIATALERDGIRAVAIHGNKSQARRQAVIRQFNSQKPPVLIATDVAARGIDFTDVSYVVNFDLPDVPETYVHRIGRTARAGAAGQAVSFCGRDEHQLLRMIERLTGLNVPVESLGETLGDARSIPAGAEWDGSAAGSTAPPKYRAKNGRSQGGRPQNGRPQNGGGRPQNGRPHTKPGAKPRRPKARPQGSPAAQTAGSNGSGSSGGHAKSGAGGVAVATRKRKFSKPGSGRRYGKPRAAGSR